MRGLRLVLVLALALFAPLGAAMAASWHRAESANFIIYAEGSAEEARGLAADMERFRQGLVTLTQAQAARESKSPKLTIYRLARRADMRMLLPGFSNVGSVAGFYRADQTGARAFSMEEEDSALRERTILQHEYAHHFMLQYFPGIYPRWFVEGFAEYVSTARMRDGRLLFGEVDPIRASWLRGEPWMPMAKLITTRERIKSDTDVGRFYAMSWLAAHFMFSTPERNQMLQAYIKAYRAGVEPLAAFETAFKAKPTAVDSQIERYVRGRMPAMLVRVAEVDPATIRVTGLPESAGQAVVQAERVRAHRDTEGEAMRGAELRASIRALPLDPIVKDLQVEMEARIGDPAAALARLGEVSNPADAGLWEGISRLRRAQTLEGEVRIEEVRSARRALVRAQKANSERAEILFRYLQTFAEESGPTPPTLIAVGRRLYELAPQSFNSNVAAAMVLSRAGAGEEAAALMAVFAANPHGGKNAEAAEEMEAFLKGGGVLQPEEDIWGLVPVPPAAAPARAN